MMHRISTIPLDKDIDWIGLSFPYQLNDYQLA